MKIKSMKYLFLFLGLGIANQTSSPNIALYASLNNASKINELEKIKKRAEIIEELKKPVSYFYPPVDAGQVSCVYGYRKDKTEFHKGIDIGIVGNASLKFAKRPDVLAAAPGIIDFAGNKTGYGKVVIIKHNNNLETIYAHLNNFFVKNGDSVLAQQKIGEMGRSGKVRSDKKSSKIHLHFEARKDNKPFNPNKYFKGYKKIGIDDTLYSSFLASQESKIERKFPEVRENLQKQEYNLKSNAKTIEPFYSIQVAATLTNLSKNEIKNLEKMYECSVKENKINGMYKYSIKQFSSLEEALGFKNSINSKDNLGIMVYKNNEIIETKWN
ncbi:M23 family metallopeptidase [Candidatus Pacearchaeota archaeon]|nr:M23 family metallopeptidase [Candidatus Pacearchaeota archaeon]